MLSFAVYMNGQPATRIDLAGAYVVGTDDVPLRAEIRFHNGIIRCNKRSAGPAGLALLWNVPSVGRFMLETVRLLERSKPYVLQVELTRSRLMRIHQKLEDWGLLDSPEGAEDILNQITQSREMLVKALQADTPAAAADLGNEALVLAVRAGEALTRFHADDLLAKRKEADGFGKRVLGCAVHTDDSPKTLSKRLIGSVDFVTVPIVWRAIEPKEQAFDWKPLDTWVESLAKQHVEMIGSALISFHERDVPDWLYIWEHDFDTIRDLAFEHIRRVIDRYDRYIHTWNVVSGLHAGNCFTFNFEQLMELTRMTAALAKQLAPNSLAVVDLVTPWGEYYARNQRTIPPLLYADMVVQSGVNFDAFGLKFHFGPAEDGMFVRDMFQISALLDLFSKLGKPLRISAVGVPSASTPPKGGKSKSAAKAMIGKAGAAAVNAESPNGGVWHEPWSEAIQAEWLNRFLEVVLSKPFVESVSWHGLVDHEDQPIPCDGLLRADLQPKAAYEQFTRTRTELHANSSECM